MSTGPASTADSTRLLGALADDDAATAADAAAEIAVLCRTAENRTRLGPQFVARLLDLVYSSLGFCDNSTNLREQAARAVANICAEANENRAAALIWFTARQLAASPAVSPLLPPWWVLPTDGEISKHCYIWTVALLNICADYEILQIFYNENGIFNIIFELLGHPLIENQHRRVTMLLCEFIASLDGSNLKKHLDEKNVRLLVESVRKKNDDDCDFALLEPSVAILCCGIKSSESPSILAKFMFSLGFMTDLFDAIDSKCGNGITAKAQHKASEIISDQLSPEEEAERAEQTDASNFVSNCTSILVAMSVCDEIAELLKKDFVNLIPRLKMYMQLAVPDDHVATQAHVSRVEIACLMIGNFCRGDSQSISLEHEFSISSSLLATLQQYSVSKVVIPALMGYRHLLIPMASRRSLGLRFMELDKAKLRDLLDGSFVLDNLIITVIILKLISIYPDITAMIVETMLPREEFDTRPPLNLMQEVVRRYLESSGSTQHLMFHVARLQSSIVRVLIESGREDLVKFVGSLKAQWDVVESSLEAATLEIRQEAVHSIECVLKNGSRDQLEIHIPEKKENKSINVLADAIGAEVKDCNDIGPCSSFAGLTPEEALELAYQKYLQKTN